MTLIRAFASIALILGSWGGLVSCSTPAQPEPTDSLPALIQPDVTTLVTHLQERIPELLVQGRVPGVSISLIRDGEIAWSEGFGVKNAETGEPVTAETIFEAASFTKPLFAYLALMLVDQGILDLDKPLVQYLPAETIERELLEHPLDQAEFRRDWFERITARQVLSHSSGMPHGERGEPFPLFFEPGTQYKYSASGYYLLQLTLEHLQKAPLEDLAEEMVLGRLGMTHSSLVWRDVYEKTAAQGHDSLGRPVDHRKRDRAHAAATLYTTAAEYARFVVAVLQGRGLQDTTWRAMLRPHIPVEANDHWSLGFGIQRDGNGDAFWQWGDYVYFRNFVIAYPSAKTGVVYLTNSYNGLSIAAELVSETIGGRVHSLDWLNYPAWDSPAQQFTFLVMDKGAEAAIERLGDFRHGNPEAVNESTINRMGYALLNAARFDDAIALFELNVRENPASANTYDSLAEAYLTRGEPGDKQKALIQYRTVLEKIPGDPNPNKDFLERLRRNAETQLAGLGAEQ